MKTIIQSQAPGEQGVNIVENNICARPGCEETFIKKTHNQKYHNDVCCRLATNKKIMDNYYKKKAQRAGKVRYCSSCHTTRLSRYNDGDMCGACQSTQEKNINNSIVLLLQNSLIETE